VLLLGRTFVMIIKLSQLMADVVDVPTDTLFGHQNRKCKGAPVVEAITLTSSMMLYTSAKSRYSAAANVSCC
jgi:hypothetical protein